MMKESEKMSLAIQKPTEEIFDIIPPEQCKNCAYGYEDEDWPTVVTPFLFTLHIGHNYNKKIQVQKCKRGRCPEGIGAQLKIYLINLKNREKCEAEIRSGRSPRFWGNIDSPSWKRSLNRHLDFFYGKKPKPCGWFKSKIAFFKVENEK